MNMRIPGPIEFDIVFVDRIAAQKTLADLRQQN